ncbi:gamma-glutamylcyclotransferase family protein [Roseateles amylovorans]|uniref:Putative gamma-glutamylcyclotransferase n=1 Tax=Roseateles amylovorans TaxID=2978473 RepID=A0ABY6B0R4_9BURK|nr:gamma-glutamylcyclotransferase family protein [Roseateles amylovorans]UXH78989.1 gamma-glutamylcyclotransferase [Roseateles amylovorans]
MAHAFTYGSLMWADIMARVCGAPSLAERAPLPATLADHVRHPVLGQDYPGMVPADGHEVHGRLYLDLPDAAWPRLDAFEGQTYERREVLVTVPDGRWLRAWTYVYREAWRHQLGAGAWDEQRFEREGKARFIASYVGFGAGADGPAGTGDGSVERG